MTRKEARDLAFKLVFQMFCQKETPESTMETYYIEHSISDDVRSYVEEIVNGIHKNSGEIDGRISGLLEGWKIERISKVSVCAIRLSIYEMSFRNDIPESVSINEAVSLAKKYEGDEAANFVNGVLASFLKSREVQ